jgi:phospholipase/carboxylesterase
LQALEAPASQLLYSASASQFHGSTTHHHDGNRLRDRRSQTGSQHALFTPMHYERNYAYPLLVWLHDEGGHERELRRLMPHVSVRNYVGAAVRGVKASADVKRGFSWGDDGACAAEAAERVRACIDVAEKRFNIHPERVFLAGYGSGGTMALRIALEHADWFAGAASICGPMPQGRSPLALIIRSRQLPLFMVSCCDVETFQTTPTAADLRLVYSAGLPLSLFLYEPPAELTTMMLSDMDRWLMQQVCPETAAAQAS